MREIKFRIWDKRNNYMISNKELILVDYYNKTISVEGFYPKNDNDLMNFKGNIYQNSSLDFIPVSFEDIVFMQFTGLKDKNGKEIYEGDILKSALGEVYAVEWEKNARFLGFTEDRKIMYIDREPLSEIIGNIYETPHLLTQRATDGEQ